MSPSVEITGRLEQWTCKTTPWGDEYWGYVYDDAKKRFADGTYIYTSLVSDPIVSRQGNLIITLNSVYQLGEEYDGRTS